MSICSFQFSCSWRLSTSNTEKLIPPNTQHTHTFIRLKRHIFRYTSRNCVDLTINRWKKKPSPSPSGRLSASHSEDPNWAHPGATPTAACWIWRSAWWFRLVVSWSLSLCLVCVHLHILIFRRSFKLPNSGNICNIRWIQYWAIWCEHMVSHVHMICLQVGCKRGCCTRHEHHGDLKIRGVLYYSWQY